MLHSNDGTLLKNKADFSCTQKDRWILNAWGFSKEARPEKLIKYCVNPFVYYSSKTMGQNVHHRLAGSGGGKKKLTTKVHEGIFWYDGSYLYFYYNDSDMTVCICQNL